MGPINISLRTLTISCDYLRRHVITIHLRWINSYVKQIGPLRLFCVHGKEIGHVKIYRKLRKTLNGLLEIVIGPDTVIRFI